MPTNGGQKGRFSVVESGGIDTVLEQDKHAVETIDDSVAIKKPNAADLDESYKVLNGVRYIQGTGLFFAGVSAANLLNPYIGLLALGALILSFMVGVITPWVLYEMYKPLIKNQQ